MAHRGGAGRQEPSILWIGRVLRHELITLPAPSPTLDNGIRLQIPLNLLSRNMSLPLVRRAKGVVSQKYMGTISDARKFLNELLTLGTLYWLY